MPAGALPEPYAFRALPPRLERLREKLGPRAVGLGLALGLEALLIALLLSLGQSGTAPAGDTNALVTFDVRSPPAAEPQTQEQVGRPATQPAPQEASAVPSPEPPPPPAAIIPRANPLPMAQPSPQQTAPAIIPLSRDAFAATDITNLAPPRPPAPMGPAYGPSMDASSDDSEVVGRAPDGEPLYAARWYREPTDGELRGYLSTASGPGYALIACRTAPQWRVEDCVGLEEYPGGSNIQRSVLAAAWQFQVRPPRRGGQSLVGSWVRIRIEYSTRRN